MLACKRASLIGLALLTWAAVAAPSANADTTAASSDASYVPADATDYPIGSAPSNFAGVAVPTNNDERQSAPIVALEAPSNRLLSARRLTRCIED